METAGWTYRLNVVVAFSFRLGAAKMIFRVALAERKNTHTHKIEPDVCTRSMRTCSVDMPNVQMFLITSELQNVDQSNRMTFMRRSREAIRDGFCKTLFTAGVGSGTKPNGKVGETEVATQKLFGWRVGQEGARARLSEGANDRA